MNFTDSLADAKMNSSDLDSNSTSGTYFHPVVVPRDFRQDSLRDTTDTSLVLISNKPCSEAFSSQTPSAAKLPGSLDALLYIVIVLMFYAFSIAILMVKYIRREREEANLRNYYHEFVSRDKFRSAQYKNTQFMKRIFGKNAPKENHILPTVEEELWNSPNIQRNTSKHKNQNQTITRNGNTFTRLTVDGCYEKAVRESFTFLSAKNQFCKNGFFGKKFCNKQLCSKCVSESVPTIDWGDERVNCITEVKNEHEWSSTVEVRLLPVEDPPTEGNSFQTCYQNDASERNYQFDGGDSTFLPIIECDSDKEGGSAENYQSIPTKRSTDEILLHSNYTTAPEEMALVSSCSLEVSELLANMPPLGKVNISNDMDTLDGLSNFDSEADSQSLLNYSASIKGSNNFFDSLKRGSPAFKTKSVNGEERQKDYLSDFLSERTSLLSCTLSIDDGEEEDAVTHLSSHKHHPNGLSISNSNGKVKEEFKSNGKSILNSLSKSVSSDEDEVMKILSDFTLLTEESGVFKNLKYFLRSFSKHEDIGGVHEKSTLLPRETYFGPGSPKSYYSDPQTTAAPTKCNPPNQKSFCLDMDAIDDDLLTIDEYENYGNRWGYTYDEEDEIYSDVDKSSSFGEYCMGETTASQVIDISKPLIRRQLDSVTRDGLNRAIIGINDSWTDDFPPVNKSNPMLAGYGSARKETKV
ncbi:unnamed protein product [Candidula unifasciata]|uniref:Uncharacterized protein n=1 Tax=Candidula unifasciata TaxID=100452 RepID=A0A8S3YTT4_9EUPU|nr:unnamed protein product [Candidula unifasciata]